MKAKFTISPLLKAGGEPGIERIETPLLMLTKFSGMGMPDDLKPLIDASEGVIERRLKARGFGGNSGEQVCINLGADCAQDRVLFVGLGKAQSFCCATVREMVTNAVDRAVALKVNRLTIPIIPNRITQGSMKLKGTASLIKRVASRVLESKRGDGTLEIEIACTPQAKRFLESGLQCRVDRKDCGDPCAKSKPRS